MFNLLIPADGSSVAVSDFAKAADEAAANYRGTHQGPENDVEYAQLEAAISSAKALVKGGHVGDENVYVVIGGIGGEDVAIGVHHRAAAVVAVVPEPPPAPPVRSPYETGATPDEIAREAANTGVTPAEAAAALGVVPAGKPAKKASSRKPAAKPAAKKAAGKPTAKASAKKAAGPAASPPASAAAAEGDVSTAKS